MVGKERRGGEGAGAGRGCTLECSSSLFCLPCHYILITLLIASGGRGSGEEGRHAALFTNPIYVLPKRDTSLAVDTSDHSDLNAEQSTIDAPVHP